MGYDFQPGESIPLSYNSYQVVFPTPPRRSRQCARLEQSSMVPVFSLVRFPIAAGPAAPIRERSLHTGEVVGSIPTAPTSKKPGFGALFSTPCKRDLAVRGRTSHEHGAYERAKSVQVVRSMFWSGSAQPLNLLCPRIADRIRTKVDRCTERLGPLL